MSRPERFKALFTGYSRRYGRFTVEEKPGQTKKSGRASTEDRPPTIEDYTAHLKGEYGIGIIPLTDDCKTFFCALDVDVYEGLDVDHYVRELVNEPVVVTMSKSGGMHIWLFSNPAVPAEISRAYMKTLAGKIGFGGCELFPKQTERATINDVGNWINLPYFGGTRTARAVVSESGDVAELDLTSFIELAEKCTEQATADYLVENTTAPGKKTKNKIPGYTGEDGPICLERIKGRGGPEEGFRNIYMFNFAQYVWRKSDENIETVRTELIKENALTEGGGISQGELDAIVKGLPKTKYGFQCKSEPLCTFCDRAACRTRKFGVGSHFNDEDFDIEGLSRIETDPPSYVMTINGKRVWFERTEDLFNPRIFKSRVFDATNKVWLVKDEKIFSKLLEDLAENMDVIKPPPGDDEASMLKMHLADFVDRKRTTDKLRVRDGNVWLNDGDGYFRLERFRQYLSREPGIRQTKRAIGMLLKDKLGAEQRRVKIGDKQELLMIVPLSEIGVEESVYDQIQVLGEK